MESFQYTKFTLDEISYNLEEREGSHQSDESHTETKSTPDFSENIELPLPPGTSGDEFFVSLSYKPEELMTSNIVQQIHEESKYKSGSFEPGNLTFGPQLPSDYQNILENQKADRNDGDSAVNKGNKIFECLGDNRYSPSKVESDEENQDVALKPKVLGKEQAKKRLMAFSIAKQSANVAKKHSKTTPAKSKEKPPNPNKGTNFQEQFRATISAIEEEKKKMYQNMPDYLLQEMNELVKGHIVSSPSLKSSDKKNQDSKRKDRSARHDSTSNKSNDRRRSSRRTRSRSSSRRRRRGRRSRSRSSGTHNKRRKRSWSRSRRSKSPGKKSREEKSVKTEEANPGKNEKDFIPKKDVFEDWKAFKDSGAAVDSDSVFLKNDFRESEGRELELDHMSQGFRSHYKPIFNYLKKGYNKMMPLRAKPADSNSGKRALFLEKTMKFTRAKPILIWTENPSLATDYYMPKEVLLENCPSGSEPILRFIIEGKICEPNTDFPRITPVKSRPWYSREKYLRDTSPYSVENELLPQSSLEDQSKNVDVQTSKRKISLVNEDYLSDEIEQEEVTVAGVKVQLDLEMNSVKYRSKWDSDFEEGSNERESTFNKTRSKEIFRGEKSQKSKGKVTEEKNKMDDFDVEALHRSPEEKPQPLTDSPKGRDTNSHPGYLASEYEEFLKMVSFDSKDSQDNQTEKVTDTVKREKMENPVFENDNNLKFSIDWDKESEQEEELKVSPQKIEAGEKLLKAEKVKKKKNRIEKMKLKKKKIMKKPIKGRKDRCKNSYREDSSSSESESESDSDSDESNSTEREKRKKSECKRKKSLKEKKKSKKNFSDKSESDSEGDKPKKKTKKKGGSSDSDESHCQDKLLEQIVLKKQLIMKKVEGIDTVMEKIDEKKGKENESKKECGEKERGLKPSKKKNKSKSVKKSKLKKFKKTDTESDSRSSGESTKKKKGKKEIKEKRFSSESSDSEDDAKNSRKKTNKYKKTKKEKKRGRKFSDSSESEDSLVSKKWKKKKKEDLNSVKDLKSNIAVTETEVRTEERLTQRDRKTLKKKVKKTKNEDDDWETSSSSVESEEECESSWDEEAKTTIKVSESHIVKEKRVDAVVPEKEGSEKNLSSDGNFNSGMETLKNSLSNFLFNENSFCCFGQELSRDFFLTERSLSSSANIGTCDNAGMTPINARPFQYIGKGGEKKTVDSELYSPGCSESEMSDAENKSQKSKTGSPTRDVYDPLNCESEASADNNEVELSTIPLPTAGGISLPGEGKLQNVVMSPPVPKVNNEPEKTLPSTTPPRKFTGNEFNLISNASLKENSPKMQIMNFKSQQTLKTKAASVFQDDSDEENKEREKSKEEEKQKKTDKETQEKKRSKKERRDGSKERNRGRSRSREKKVMKSPRKAPEASKREIRSDSFEIEPLKSVTDEIVDSVQPIPVLLGVSSNRVWSGSLPGYEFSQVSDSLVDQAESFDIYPSEESKYHTEDYNRDLSIEKPTEKSNKRRKSQSRSVSPKKKQKSKSPIRRRSPKRWSASPKLRDKSPRSPRRRSPKRKSPSRRRSRSPSRRRKSRRLSSPRRSRSKSPPKRRSPKRWDSPHRRKDSPTRGYSPRRDSHYSNYPELPYWVGTLEKNGDMEVNRPCACSPQYDSSMAFPGMPAPSVNEGEMNNSFYESEYNNEYGVSSYREEIGINNLITIKNHSVEKMESPKRPSLDQRIELELGSPISSSSSQYPSTSQPPQTFEGADPNHYQTYNCDNSSASENFYQNQAMPDFNGQYFNEVQPSNYGSYPYAQPPSVQNAVMQVGNIVEVVPAALQHPLQPPLPPPKTPQIMQVGNVLQVVPTQKVPTPTPVPPPVLDYDSLPSSPVVKTQKATAVVAPSSVVPPPNLEAMINPLIKAILLEREKRRKAKEKRRLEREARRKARQLRREAKLMSVSEKLKKSVQNEGLVLGQEVEDDELLDAMDIPSPPVPVQIITVSSPSAASPAGKGILITAGFVSKSPSKKKEVKFADGVYPGEGTSSSGEEDIPLSPPKPKLPKEKPFRKKKIKVKKKVKVHIIKQILHEEEDDECDDNLSPPPPPPGDPPPVFFARFPFAGNTQFPVYQTQTTTATAQYPAQAV